MAKTSRAEWAKRVERWGDSGLTAREFAAELDVTPGSLTFWKWKLRQLENAGPSQRVGSKREKRSHGDAPTKFLQLVPAPASVSLGTFELLMPRGVTLRVPSEFDDAALLRLIELLGVRS